VTAIGFHTSRTVAADAAPVLEEFRKAGSRSFHLYGIDEVRQKYEDSCRANGIPGDALSSVSDFGLGRFSVRVYEPRKFRGPTPVVLFIHGGGWIMGSLETHDGLCRRLASLTGLPVFAVDYRLAPEHPHPAAIDDCREALEWLSAGRKAHGVEATSAVLAGDSAGGQIAAVLAIENANGDSGLRIDAQVLIYPITDLTMSTPSYQRVTQGFPLVAGTMAWFADHYLPAGIDRSAPEISPAFAALPANLPPAYVLTVDNDPLADEGAAYAAALARAGTDVRYRHLAGYAHGLFTSAGRIPRGQHEVEEIAAFVRAHTA
jgi:acetyl esterase